MGVSSGDPPASASRGVNYGPARGFLTLKTLESLQSRIPRLTDFFFLLCTCMCAVFVFVWVCFGFCKRRHPCAHACGRLRLKSGISHSSRRQVISIEARARRSGSSFWSICSADLVSASHGWDYRQLPSTTGVQVWSQDLNSCPTQYFMASAAITQPSPARLPRDVRL